MVVFVKVKLGLDVTKYQRHFDRTLAMSKRYFSFSNSVPDKNYSSGTHFPREGRWSIASHSCLRRFTIHNRPTDVKSNNFKVTISLKCT